MSAQEFATIMQLKITAATFRVANLQARIEALKADNELAKALGHQPNHGGGMLGLADEMVREAQSLEAVAAELAKSVAPPATPEPPRAPAG